MQNRIKEKRKEAGLSQEELADAIGTSTQQISRLERAERRLSDRWLDPIAQALGITKASLLVERIIPPGVAPRKSDLAKDDVERRLLAFWRALSADAQDFILTTVDAWSNRFGDDSGE